MASQKKTIEQKIAEELTDRKILHFRYDANLRKLVYPKLNKLQKEIVRKLSAVGVETIKKRELNNFLKEVKEIINETYAEINTEQQSELSEFLSVEHEHLSGIYNNAVGYDLINQMPEYKLNALKKAPLIAGTPLQEWWSKQGNDYSRKFQGIVRQGLLNGKQTSEIITELKNVANIQRRNAETLVITAVGKVADTAHEALKDENADLLQGEEHLSTLDTRTSTVCQLRDGKRWSLDKKPVGHSIPYARPPLHPRCRSILQMWFKSWKELGYDDLEELDSGTRASEDGQVKSSMNYEDWLKGKTKAQQDEILGKGKADLWRRNVITFSDMLDQTGRPLTLTELQRKFNPHFIEPVVDTKALKEARFQSSQLKRKFNKHANHLGIDTTRNNPATQKEFQNKIVDFMNSPNIIQRGVYKKRNPPSVVFYDKSTKVAVIFDGNNYFETVLQLEDGTEQYLKYINEEFLW
ncbi:minor capsid protein [Phocoenobacter skyensis]|uniref:Phage putative head morphogenesis protein, SPP1 gp7 family n=1 Tax=Phocoenobacter skyensis TaxID=97481 RepID=A0A1H8AE90_9PAST|nr:minor capsid protein [Pasteurella skyensis]MDP8184399.1 colicin D domain-containing protein [Pasteurella skyensis]QLB22599.1 hypothetical protein A6B44_05015 [Pasteurella skyensis]SEM68119.1 phage putative head morphogenesis protein, SPP1 gp7 family [Pasteurella skyensis]